MSLYFCCDIPMVGSEFDVKVMKACIYIQSWSKNFGGPKQSFKRGPHYFTPNHHLPFANARIYWHHIVKF